jgi:hypothetical protein
LSWTSLCLPYFYSLWLALPRLARPTYFYRRLPACINGCNIWCLPVGQSSDPPRRVCPHALIHSTITLTASSCLFFLQSPHAHQLASFLPCWSQAALPMIAPCTLHLHFPPCKSCLIVNPLLSLSAISNRWPGKFKLHSPHLAAFRGICNH